MATNKPLSPSQIAKLQEMHGASLRKANPFSDEAQDFIENSWEEYKAEIDEACVAAINRVLERKRGCVPAGPDIIDLDAAPFIPEGWEVRESDQLTNRVCGRFEWNPARFYMFLANGQKGNRTIRGYELRRILENQQVRVLPANVLDWMLEHPNVITQTWEIGFKFFWGTIYRDQMGLMCVRGIRKLISACGWDHDQLDHSWFDSWSAVALAA